MPRRKCWGQPVIYSCGARENWGCDRTRFALDDRLNNEVVIGAGHYNSFTEAFALAGLALRPFPFRVVTHSDSNNGPDETMAHYDGVGVLSSDTPFWNSCQAKDGCGDGGEHARCMTEEQMIRWLLADA